jgi:hypothetical protein
MGLWHVGTGFAQIAVVPSQPTVEYAVYGVPSVENGSTQVEYAIATNETFSPVTAMPASFVSTSPVVLGGTTRNWALDIANVKMNLDANRLTSPEAVRPQLDQAIANLENFLATSPQHQANWLSFLAWTKLREELSKPKPSSEAITQFEMLFRQNYFGLEMPQFTQVRDALQAYAAALRFGTKKTETVEILNNRLSRLSEDLQTPDFSSNFQTTRSIGQTLRFLSQSNQGKELVNSVLPLYSKANFRLLVSSEFVQQKFTRPVNEANPVQEVILGTRIYGQSWLNGFVTPQLLDNSANAALRLNLNGDFSSQSIGYNRSVKLHTQGAANILAGETIALTDNGLVALNDAYADAGLSSSINDIEAKLKIVRKIAAKQAAKQKPTADAIAEGRLENRIRTQFHEKLSQQISEANEKLKTPDLPALKRLGLQKPNRSTWSSSQYLSLLWKLQQGDQLAAPASCPLPVDPSGITLQLHESAISNLTDPVLAGRILRSSEMGNLAAQFGDALGVKQIKDDEEQPWAITMDKYHPVEVQLDNSLVTFRIRTTNLDRGDQALEQDAAISADYKVILVDGTIQLERQGEVQIDFSGKQQRGVRAVTLRSFLKRKFDEVFRVQLLDKPVRVTEKLPAELQNLQLTSVVIDDGWIQAQVK